jgi:hypothetical protein
MSNFEFLFSLLVILLGLGLGHVLGGLASVVKRRPPLASDGAAACSRPG